MGSLTFAFIDPEEAAGWVRDYEARLAEHCVPVGHHVNANVACVTPMMCAPSEEEAVARGLEGGNFFGYSLGHYYVFGDHRPGITDVWAEFVQRRDELGYSPDVAAALADERLGAKIASGEATGLRGATGTPAQIREYVAPYEAAGVDQLIFVMQAGRNRHEDICESLELFGRAVLPEFKARDQALVDAKAERLAPVIDAAMARRSAEAVSVPDDYHFPAIPRRMVDAAGSVQGKEMLERFADERAVGSPDDSLGIIG